MTIRDRQNKNRGFSLIESLIYIAILAIMTTLIVNMLIVTVRSYNNLKISRNINNSMIMSLERITRSIKSADNVLVLESTFDTHPGVLTLQAGATTTEFYLSGGTLRVKENTIDTGSLTQQNLSVDSLVFTLFDNGTSKGVRINMTVSIIYKDTVRTKDFYSFAVLRN